MSPADLITLLVGSMISLGIWIMVFKKWREVRKRKKMLDDLPKDV